MEEEHETMFGVLQARLVQIKAAKTLLSVGPDAVAIHIAR